MAPLGFLTTLYRPRCAACDAHLDAAQPLCVSCAQSLYPIESACPRCALPIQGEVSIECATCRRTPPPVAATASPFRYGGELASALRRIKFARRADLTRALAPLFSQPLARALDGADAVVVVPLHWQRLAVRGFNQSERLYRHAAPKAAPPLLHALERRRKTPPQSALSPRGRRRIRGAFAVRSSCKRRLRDQRLLLFDDIMTTGATIYAAARALLAAGALEVRAFCVARVED